MNKEYNNRQVFIYIVECIIGLCICYTLYKSFPQHQFFWSMVSLVLVIAPDSKSSNQLAFGRMKANILGSSIGLLLFLIHEADLFLICVGVILTIITGTLLQLRTSLRSSLAALVIVMIHEEQHNSAWHIALERVGCVMVGCITGLLITVTFNFFSSLIRKKNSSK